MDGGAVRIRRAALDAIVQHAIGDEPLECCGLLVGTDEEVHEAHRTGNLRASPVAYRVDPADHFAILRDARRRELEIVGAYHSHPRSPARPSPSDVGESNDPGLLHVIVSLASPQPAIAAYRIADGGYSAVKIITIA